MSDVEIDTTRAETKRVRKLLTDSQVAELNGIIEQDGGKFSFARRVNQIHEQQSGQSLKVASTERSIRRITEPSQDDRVPLSLQVAKLLSIAFSQMSVPCPSWCTSLTALPLSDAEIDTARAKTKRVKKLLTDSEVAELNDIIKQDGGKVSFARRVKKIREQQSGLRISVGSVVRILIRITHPNQDDRHPASLQVAELLSIAFSQMSVQSPSWCSSLIGTKGALKRDPLDPLRFPPLSDAKIGTARVKTKRVKKLLTDPEVAELNGIIKQDGGKFSLARRVTKIQRQQSGLHLSVASAARILTRISHPNQDDRQPLSHRFAELLSIACSQMSVPCPSWCSFLSVPSLSNVGINTKRVKKLLTDPEVAELNLIIKQDGGKYGFARRVKQIQEQQSGQLVNVDSIARILIRITHPNQDDRVPLSLRVAELLSIAFSQMLVQCPSWCSSLIATKGVLKKAPVTSPSGQPAEAVVEGSPFLKTQEAVATLMAESLAAKRPLTIVAPNLSIFPLTLCSGDSLSQKESLLSTKNLAAILKNAGIRVIISVPDLQYWIQQNPPELLNAMAQWLQSEPSVVPYLTDKRLNGTFIGSSQSTLYLPPDCSKGMFEDIPAPNTLGKDPSILENLFWDLASSAPKDHRGTANVIRILQEMARMPL
jgi:hypothetical protein